MANPTYLSQQPAQASIASIAGKGGRIELPPVVKRNGTVGYVSAKPPAKPAAKSSPEELQERAAAAKRDAESRENARWFLQKYTEQFKKASHQLKIAEDHVKQSIISLNMSLDERDKIQDRVGIGLNLAGIAAGILTGGVTALVVGVAITGADMANSNVRVENPADKKTPIADGADFGVDVKSTLDDLGQAHAGEYISKLESNAFGVIGVGFAVNEAMNTTALSISNAQAADSSQLQSLSKQVEPLTDRWGDVGTDAQSVRKDIGALEDKQKEYAKALRDYVFAVRNAEHWKVTLSSPR